MQHQSHQLCCEYQVVKYQTAVGRDHQTSSVTAVDDDPTHRQTSVTHQRQCNDEMPKNKAAWFSSTTNPDRSQLNLHTQEKQRQTDNSASHMLLICGTDVWASKRVSGQSKYHCSNL